MTSSQYIDYYGMTPVGNGSNRYYRRKIEKGQNTLIMTLYKMELTNECYLVKQTLYSGKFNPKTQTYGVLGKAYFTFGIKNTTFKHSEAEEEYEYGTKEL